MAYNLTGLATNTTGLLTFTQGINSELMGGMLGILLLISIAVVMFMSFLFTTNDVNKAVVGTAFISFTLALSLKALDLVPNLALFITLIIAAIAIAVSWKRS